MPYSHRYATRTPFRTHRYSAAAKIQSVVRARQARPKVKNLKLNPTVAKLVDRRINKDNESHHSGYWWRRYQWSNKIADDVNNRINNVFPDIPVGSSRDNRTGAQLKLTRVNIKGNIHIPADDNPVVGTGDRACIYVRLMVLSSKKFKQVQEVRSNWTGGTQLNDEFFKTDAAGQAPSGNMIDMYRQINTDSFTTHYDRVMRLERNAFSGDIAEGYAPQRPVYKDFSINLKCKNKILKFEDQGAVQNDTWQPFVCYLFAYGNGSAPSLSNVPYIEYLSSVSFKPN